MTARHGKQLPEVQSFFPNYRETRVDSLRLSLQHPILMKNTLKVICLALGAGLCAFPLLRAEDQPTPAPAPAPDNQPGGPSGDHWGDRAQRREQHLIKALNLTADQQAKWAALNQQMMADLKALKADASVPQDQRRDKAQALRQSYQNQKEALLTPDQLQKLKTLKSHGHHEHPEEGGANGTPPPPPPAPGGT